MHLLAATPGAVDDGQGAVDLQQTPADIVVLSAADTELAALSAAYSRLQIDSNTNISSHALPSLRLASLLHLSHNLSVDLYLEQVIRHARLVVVRLLGGRGYWSYGVEQVHAVCRRHNIALALLPGDSTPDAELQDLSTLAPDSAHRLWQYLVNGGPLNADNFLRYAFTCMPAVASASEQPQTDALFQWREPVPVLPAGVYWPGVADADVDAVRLHWRAGEAVVPIVFYRALLLASNLAAIDALLAGLRDVGLNPLPIYVASLKDPASSAVLASILADVAKGWALGPVLNTTGFALGAPGTPQVPTPFDAYDLPVLQAVLSGGTLEDWQSGVRGLSPRDIAMHIALPEVDGRIITRAVSFKGLARRDDATQLDVVTYVPEPSRIAFVCELARGWAALRLTPAKDRRVALVLANYPNRDGRMGNGVGLDTPQATVEVLRALRDAGYALGADGDCPKDGNALVARLRAGQTNNHDRSQSNDSEHTLSLADYESFFATLPEVLRNQITERWGPPQDDPFMRRDSHFSLAVFVLGNVVVGLQPARGYNIDPQASYHDPDLVPPHGYLAFYAWLRRGFGVHAMVHMGKHGNLEWLPGKSLVLSNQCYPEAALGALPHLYPFIVNDPGEGTQAKRRAGAVIIDHLTPPLTRAESYGPLRDLERLVDEYFEASGSDPRRTRVLRDEILSLCRVSGLDEDLGMQTNEDAQQQLGRLDAYLCELKEMQIRDGLHIFGCSPVGEQRDGLLTALVRVPRGSDHLQDASLMRALANDLSLDFDPLNCDMAAAWGGPRPDALASVCGDVWRTCGDTLERIERLALALIGGRAQAHDDWGQTRAVLDWVSASLGATVDACGPQELAGLLRGLDGRFVAPGPSGAPTRGRVDVLPTGRNFYSVDTRMVPTPAAWTLGWRTASMLVESHAQATGDWPRRFALSAWGTSNMRTGGDDIAQALALMGVQPTWESASGRVNGFEIMPHAVLGRPRVDVTLRISGFFRDAFPALIDLFDSAARAVAALDEPEDINPLAARTRRETAAMVKGGMAADEAARRAGYRVFGSMPGAYGAGLQALMDENGWTDETDLARAYVAWGGYAYGGGADGQAAHDVFETRLRTTQAVLQNQDNREHDLLDSDDYYQFEGGMTAAVRVLSGTQPNVWHTDTSRPETPHVRTLEDEIARVVRARVVNPKWISGVMRHGYKGAFEMAATVDYLVSFAATAHCVRDHHFDAVFDAYLGNAEVLAFLRDNNPDALAEMAARLLDAQARGLWRTRLNSAGNVLAELTHKN